MIDPLTDATLEDLVILRRIMAQSMRDNWPGVNQPYQPKDDDDGD